MVYGFARCLLMAGLTTSALLACSSEDPLDNGGGAGSSSGGSTAGSPTGGSSSKAGSTGTAGSSSGGTGTAGTNANAGTGTGGAAAGSGGKGGAAGSGGSGGATGGGGSGGGAAVPTAVATIAGLMGKAVTGTATFTQGATMTTLVLNLTACPAGPHASHLHAMKDCGNDGNAAGGHWPNGEDLGDYTCADNKGTLTVMKPIAMWTVGDGSPTDVTKYSFMVHEMGGTDPGGRIGCGVINKQ